jgi:hypothetical protein
MLPAGTRPTHSSSGATAKPTACDAPSSSATPQAPSQRPASSAASGTGAASTTSCSCACRSRATHWPNTQAQAKNRKKDMPGVIR